MIKINLILIEFIRLALPEHSPTTSHKWTTTTLKPNKRPEFGFERNPESSPPPPTATGQKID
jgi:hypothetical protein